MNSIEDRFSGRCRLGAAVFTLIVLVIAVLPTARAADDAPLSLNEPLTDTSPITSGSEIEMDPLNALRIGHAPYDPEWVAAGWAHSCGLRINGAVDCWGEPPTGSDFGQTSHKDGPFSQIAVGGNQTCGLTTAGRIECWGEFPNGQDGPFVQVTVGDAFACGLKGDGTTLCWGDTSGWTKSTPAGPFKLIDAGQNHVCGLRSDNGTIECWGKWDYENPAGSFLQLSAGFYHACGLRTDLSIDCWGNNTDDGGGAGGQAEDQAGPFVQVSAGGWHSCGLKPDGSVDCWGENGLGESNDPEGRFRQISAGSQYNCGLKRFGDIDCWGWDLWGASVPPNGPFGQIIGRPVAIDDRYHTGIGESLIVGAYGVLANDNNAIGDAHVYYLDTNGHIHELLWFSNWWNHFDITARTGSPPAAGGVLNSVSANGDPCVYYVAADGHIHELAWHAGQMGHTWYHRDLTSEMILSPVAPGSPLSSTSVGGYPHVYYLDAAQHINQLAWTDNGWTHLDLTQLAGATPAVPGSPLSATTTANGDPAIYYFTPGYSVHELAKYGNRWLHWDLTSDSTGPVATQGSQLVALRVQGDPRVYYRSADNHIHELAWMGGEWLHSDLMSQVSTANPTNVAGVFNAITIIDDAPRVYYQDSDNHINELAWSVDSWNYVDLSEITLGRLPMTDSPLSVSTAYLSPRVHYLTDDGQVHELAWIVDKWYHVNLTLNTDAPPVAMGSLLSATAASVDPLTTKLVDSVDHGSLTLDKNGSFTYTPQAGFEGQDSFTYKANDWWSLSDEVNVSITVGPPMAVVDVDISLYSNPAGTGRTSYENVIHYFADALYESTNGARKLGAVTFYTANTHADTADILWANQKCHPSASYTYGFSAAWLHINFCDIFEWCDKDGNCDGYDFLLNDTQQKGGGYALGHEWGHYYFGLFDEYPIQENDVAVEKSIMNSQWNALNGDNNWLNFSIPANFNLANSQGRLHEASGWTTLMRPSSEDPRTTAEQLGLPIRHAFRDLQRVGPIGDQTSPIELPGTARSELSIQWVAPSAAEAARNMAAGIPLHAEVTSLLGNVVSYPDPLVLVAVVQKDLPLTGVGVQASMKMPDSTSKTIAFKDDGIPPDAKMGDGLYTAVLTYAANGIHTVQVQFDNHARKAVFVTSAYEPSAGVNGEFVPMPSPNPYATDFVINDTLEVLVTNVSTDDHGNVPSTARSMVANNEPMAGKIEKAGDKDVFRLQTLPDRTTYVRVTNLALGMNPRIRVLDSDGKTVLFERRHDANISTYPFIPLFGVEPGSIVYVEVSQAAGTASGGLYEFSAGQKLSSDEEHGRVAYMIEEFGESMWYTAVHLADMNGDGNPEVLIGNRDTSSLEIWRFDRMSESLIKIDTIEFPYQVHDIKAADFNGDAAMDIVVGLRGSGLYYAGNIGKPGTIGNWEIRPIDETYSWQVLVGNVDNDGKLDILDGVDYGPIKAFYGDGNGNFVEGNSIFDPSTDMRFAFGFNLIDLNGDNRLDLIGTDGSFMRAFLNPGDRNSNWQSVGPDDPIGSYPCCEPLAFMSRTSPSSADLDGNGVIDQVGVLGSSVTESSLEVLILKGSKTGSMLNWSQYRLDTLPKLRLSGHVGVADLDSDGYMDIHMGGWENFNDLYLYFGNGQGGFTAEMLPLDFGVGGFNSFAVGDINGDEVMDIVTNRYTADSAESSGFVALFGVRQRFLIFTPATMGTWQ